VKLLIATLAAMAAGLLAEVFDGLRQRSLAAARAQGASLASALGVGWRSTFAARLEAGLPAWLARDLSARLALAGDSQGPGNFAMTALAGFLSGAILGLVLNSAAATGVCALLGLALPFFRLRDRHARRQAAFRRQLPDALDLLTACVEAGLGFDQALARVAARLGDGSLRAELENTVAALGLGASRRVALRDLEARLGLEEASQWIAALLQADRRGTPLGPALRAQSGQLRRLRTLRVKKLAAEAPLKMLFPLMAFILPVVFIVLFGPIVLKWKAGGF
jgi:tight adherence protein C